MFSLSICAQLMLFGIFHATDAIFCSKIATEGQFKYLVEIIENECGYEGICGGAVLDETHVLTAAHCVSEFDKEDLSIIAGTNDLRSAHRIKRGIKKFHIHEKYKDWENVGKFEYYGNKFLNWLFTDHKRPPLENDIAVLTLDEALPLGENISSVRLPISLALPYYQMISFAAWGNIARNTCTNILRWTKFQIIDDIECRERSGLDSRLQFCTMDPKENSCALPGDSGAPLVYNDIVIGVTSHTFLHPDSPAIFTQVFYYSEWIEEILLDDN